MVASAGGTWRSRHYAVRGAFLKELVATGEFRLLHVATDDERIAREYINGSQVPLFSLSHNQQAQVRWLLATARDIGWAEAKRMVHRRGQYEAKNRLAELSPSLLTDPRMPNRPCTQERRRVKDSKPAAQRFHERVRQRKGSGKQSKT